MYEWDVVISEICPRKAAPASTPGQSVDHGKERAAQSRIPCEGKDRGKPGSLGGGGDTCAGRGV